MPSLSNFNCLGLEAADHPLVDIREHEDLWVLTADSRASKGARCNIQFRSEHSAVVVKGITLPLQLFEERLVLDGLLALDNALGIGRGTSNLEGFDDQQLSGDIGSKADIKFLEAITTD
eukprot:14070619-Heterocapsa_arctica.AAC.1